MSRSKIHSIATSVFGKKQTRTRGPRRLNFQSLEGRQLMAADIALVDGVLSIEGTEQTDVVEIRETRVETRLGSYDAIEALIADSRGNVRRDDSGRLLQRTFDAKDVDSIFAEAHGGNDRVYNRTDLPSVMYGGSGSDTLSGGSADDDLFGEGQRDYLYGHRGRDLLDGGRGDDYLYGHDGDDFLFGDDGVDRLWGHDGNDRMVGGDDTDYLYGGDDYDWLDGGRGFDYLYGQAGGDMVYDTSGSQGWGDPRVYSHMNEAWFDMHTDDDELRSVARSLWIRDGELSRDDMLQVFDVIKDMHPGPAFTYYAVNGTELNDLREMVAYSWGLGMPEHVRVLSSKVVGSNVANANFQGEAMGDLYAGASASHLSKLVGKWFLGEDRPDIGNDDYTYQYAVGSLFKNGISHTDVQQGAVGDCFYMSALAAAALQDPSVIEDMFIDNGDETFTVRFFVNRVGNPVNGDADIVDYVTVDRYLPANPTGFPRFARIGGNINWTGTELWVALAEKALAQINESDQIGQNGTNSYDGIAGGSPALPMEFITGEDVFNFYSFADGEGQQTLAGGESVAIDLESTIADALAAGRMITLSTGYTSELDDVYNFHAYAITAFDASTSSFTIYNPWGSDFNVQLTAVEIAENFLAMYIL